MFRFLLGTGPRFKICSNKFLHLYAAGLLKYEFERELYSLNIHNDFRNSSYASIWVSPNSIVEMISINFYRPLLKHINDFRILNQTSLKIKTGKNLVVKIDWN
jgi:hypothetical protein